MAFTGIAALVAGEVATTALVLSAIAEVGLAMSVVGAVTGSKDLMKIGGVMSLVGGIGGMVNGAMNGASMTVQTEAQMGSAVDSSLAQYRVGAEAAGTSGLGTEGLKSAMSNVEAKDYAGAINEGQQAALNTLDPGAANSTASTLTAPTEAVNATQTVNPAQIPDPTKIDVANPTAQQLINEPAKAAYSAAQDSQANVAIDAAEGPGSALKSYTSNPVDSKTWFNDFFDWAKKNEKLATAGATLISGGLSGMGQMKMADMQQEANRMRFQYGNEVADYRGKQPNRNVIIGRVA